MTRTGKKWLVYLLAALLAVAFAVMYWRGDRITVDTARAELTALQEVVQEQGQTRVREHFSVAAPVTGRLERLTLQEGDRVTKGQIIARLAPPPDDPRVTATLRSALLAARARESAVQAELNEAQSVYKRAQSEARRRAELHRQGLVSVETRDLYAQTASAARAHLASVQASLAAAGAEVESAQSQLLGSGTDQADDNLLMLRAPVSGRVLKVHQKSERVVTAGTPLLELGETQALELVVDVLTQDAVRIKPGNPIHISGWGDSDLLRGTVRLVESAAFTKVSALGVEEQRVNVIGDITDMPAALGAGYRVEAAIVTWRDEQVLTVPNSAVFRRNQAWYVFVINGDIARLTRIETGRQGAERVQCLQGLSQGDEVIVYPSDLIADGVRVQPQTEQ